MKKSSSRIRTARGIAAFVSCCFTFLASAQLDSRCTVSVLNRSAQVQSGGRWVVRNVPTNLGRVRARATCTRNGQTIYGESAFFTVPPSGVVAVQEIKFADVRRAPVRLVLSTPQTTIPAAGETLALTASATYPDGAVVNVTSGLGTVYRTSNPAIVSVSDSGLLTAVGNGTVIVTAANDGALALVRIAVTGGILDSDEDGMPDSWEQTYGLNPSNPADAAQDADGDGVTNLDEFRAGTDPTSVDTDGDGIRDGLELQLDTDPLDPSSYDLARALRAIHVAPSPLGIIVNTVEGTASRLLSVTGELVDDTSINLRARSRGTSYTVADSAVATLSLRDGEVIAVSAGSTAITVSNSGFTRTVPVTVTTFAPAVVGAVAIPGYANDIELAGAYCFIAAGSADLQVVRANQPAQPAIVSSLPLAGESLGLRVADGRAYLAQGNAGLAIVDVNVPAQPTLLGTVDTPGVSSSVAASGTLVFIADTNVGLQIIDASDPGSPQIIATVLLSDIHSVDAAGSVVAVGRANGAIRLIDVSNPAAPAMLSNHVVNTGIWATEPIYDLRFHGSRLFAAAGMAGFAAIDVTNPTIPFPMREISVITAGAADDLAISGGFVFAADPLDSNGVMLFDTADPALTFFRTRLSGGPVRSTGVAANSRYVFRVGGDTRRTASQGTSELTIIEYRSVVDAEGIAPSIAIASPASPATATEGALVELTVEAADDVAVADVQVTIDGRIAGAANVPPYRIPVRIPPASQPLTVVATARDFGGLATSSAPLEVLVNDDTTVPVVSINAPASVAAGGSFTVTVNASDDTGITAVTLLVNGLAAGTRMTAPYTFTLDAPGEGVDFGLDATATDHAGNTGSATQVRVTLTGDRPPVVRIASPAPAATLYTGSELVIHVTATDDLDDISLVEYLVNGQVVDTATRVEFPAHYEGRYVIPSGVTALTLTVRATTDMGQIGHAPAMQFTVKPTSAASALPLPGIPYDVDVQNTLAFVAGGLAGVHVIDVSAPDDPALLTTVDTPGTATGVVARGPLVYVADGNGGLQVIDASIPGAAFIAGTLETTGSITELAQRGTRLYAAGSIGLHIIDITNPLVPRQTNFIGGTEFPPLPVMSVAIAGDKLLQVNRRPRVSGAACCVQLQVSDLTDPDHPQQTGTLGPELSGLRDAWGSLLRGLDPGDYVKIVTEGNTAYLAGEDYLFVIDVANPAFPHPSSFYDPEYWHFGYSDMTVNGGLAVVAWSDFQNGAAIIDWNEPKPFINGLIDFSSFGTYHGLAIDATRELVYTTGTNMHRGNIANATSPVTGGLYIGRYATVVDTVAIQPSVSLTAHTSATMSDAGVFLLATASDDRGVASVTLRRNGTVVGIDRVAPFEFYVTLPHAGTHTFIATATDFGGNTGISAPQVVEASADAVPPAVTLRRPLTGETVPGAIRFAADATDNFSIARVEFIANGAVVGSDSLAPYDLEYTVPAGAVSVSVSARAFDPAGNSAETETRTIPVMVPEVLSSFAVTGFANDVDVNGDYAYVAAGAPGLRIVSLADPANPVVVSSLSLGFNTRAERVRVHSNYAYVGYLASSGVMYVAVVDVADPLLPSLVTATAITGSNGSVAIDGTRAYAGTRAYDISNPAAPQFLFSYTGSADRLEESEVAASFFPVLRAYTLFSSHSLVAVDTRPTSPTRPTMNFGLRRNGTIGGISAADEYVAAATESGLWVTDLPSRFSWNALVAGVPLEDVRIHDHYIAAATKENPARSILFDTANRRRPANVASVSFASSGSAFRMNSIVLTPTLMLATAYNAPNPIESSGDTKLLIARYRTFNDQAGQSPVGALTAPSSVRQNRLLALSATASDDVAVKAVVFRVGGIDIFTDTVAPYQFNYLVPSGAVTLDVAARIVDFAGNHSTTPTSQVSVLP
jgi:hypothetical protein